MYHLIINSNKNYDLARAKCISITRPLYYNYLTSLGYSSYEMPYGNTLAALIDLPGEWFVLSPINWHASHNDAYISSCTSDSKKSFQKVAAFLEQDGFKLHYYNKDIWLCSKNKAKPSFRAKAIYDISAQSMMPQLAELDISGYWQRVLTEIQMLLIDNELNGVWCWGDGVIKKGVKAFRVSPKYYKLAQLFSSNVKTVTSDIAANFLLDDVAEIEVSALKKLSRRTRSWVWNDAHCEKKGLLWL